MPKPTRPFKEIFEEAYGQRSGSGLVTQEEKEAILRDLKIVEESILEIMRLPSFNLLTPAVLAAHRVRLQIERIRTILGE